MNDGGSRAPKKSVEPFAEVSSINKIASYAAIVTVVVPAMLLSGFFPDWSGVDLGTALFGATVGAALSGWGYVHGRAPWYVGVLGGALVAPGALLAVYFWTKDRSTVLRIEIAIAFLAGGTPGFVAYYFLFKKVVGS